MFGVVPRWRDLLVASGWGYKSKYLIGTWVGIFKSFTKTLCPCGSFGLYMQPLESVLMKQTSKKVSSGTNFLKV